MNKFTQAIKNFWQDEEGLTIVEYAVAGALIAAALILSFEALGDAVRAVIDGITTELGGNAPA